MNPKNVLIDAILSMDEVGQINKTMGFAKILFTMDKDEEGKYEYKESIDVLELLEQDVCRGLNLNTCYELYYKYKPQGLNNKIVYRKANGKILKFPLKELRKAIRLLYINIVELIMKSGIIETSFDIGESGNLKWGEKDEKI